MNLPLLKSFTITLPPFSEAKSHLLQWSDSLTLEDPSLMKEILDPT